MMYYICYTQITGEVIYPPLWIVSPDKSGQHGRVLCGEYNCYRPGNYFGFQSLDERTLSYNKRWWTTNIDKLPGEVVAALMRKALTDKEQHP